MWRDATAFAQALMDHGFTLLEAKAVAEMIVHGEGYRYPIYPCSIGVMLGRRPCQITAALDPAGELVVSSLEFPACPPFQSIRDLTGPEGRPVTGPTRTRLASPPKARARRRRSDVER
jgi:hypothetical protein